VKTFNNFTVKTSPIKFIFIWFVSVTIIGIVIYPIFTALFVTYYDASPGLRSLKTTYKIKNKIIKTYGQKPVLYIVGGSSAFYGISASLIESKLKRRVINYGVHGGLGLEYQLKKLTPKLKSNDSVLIAFEFTLLNQQDEKLRDFLLHYIFSYDPTYLFELDPSRSLKLIYGVPFSDFKKSITRYNNFINGEINERRHKNNLLMSKRGDSTSRGNKKRPLKEETFNGLGEFSKEVLTRFFEEAKKKNIEIFWTWSTAYKNDRFFEKSVVKKYALFIKYLENNSITVLDSYTEHLYPELFYTNTYNHLSEAGKHIRTEKIIRSIRPYLAPAIPSNKSRDIFLLDPDTHILNQNKVFQNIDFEYRILGNQNTEGLILNWDDIKKLLKNNKQKIYFSDKSLKQKAVINNLGFNTVECKTRSLANDIDRYPNHIFLLMYKNIKKVDQNTAMGLPGQFSKALQGTGYRTVIIGTGKYSRFYSINVDSSIVKFSQKKNIKIESYKLPFKIDMISTGFNVKPSQKCQLKIDGNSFLNDNKSGLAVLVVEPELGIVVDNFLYESLKEQNKYCLYELSESSANYKIQLLTGDDFVLTGKTKPALTNQENSSVIQFKGKNSLWISVDIRFTKERSLSHECP